MAADLLGIFEIAELTGLRRGTVDVLRHRGQLPEPDLTVSHNPAWYRSTIETWWAARHPVHVETGFERELRLSREADGF